MLIFKTEADIRHFVFFTHAECAIKMFTHAECELKNVLRMLSMRSKMCFGMFSQHRSNFRKLSKHFTLAECALKNVLCMLSMR